MTKNKARGAWRREISLGGSIPQGWRMAWYEPRRRVGVYYPAPLHWLMRIWREIRHRLRIAWGAPAIEKAQSLEMERRHEERERLAEEYARGYLAGWRECFQTCIEAVEDEMAIAEDAWDIAAMLTRDTDVPKSN